MMKSQKGGMSVRDMVVLCVIAVAVIIGLVAYNNHASKKAAVERQAAEKARLDREAAEKSERERRLREEEEFERKKREAKLAREKEDAERAEAERERKRKAEEEEAERLKSVAEASKWRADYLEAQSKFATTFGFMKNAPAEENPYRISNAKSFWCVFATYSADKVIYAINAEPGGGMTVFALRADSAPEPVDVVAFAQRLKKDRAAITSGGQVWLTGVALPSGVLYAVPERNHVFRVDEQNLGDIYETSVALGMVAPNIKFRVRLKSESGKTNIAIGTIGYDETLERGCLEEAIAKQLGAKARSGISTASKVKKRKFKRTVVLYDGVYIKQEIGGVTKVPREYNFIGTTNYKMDDHRAENAFRKKWEALHAEALRQEAQEKEIEAEYAAAIAAEKAERENAVSKALAAADDESVIDAALAKCRLFVEAENKGRSKAK